MNCDEVRRRWHLYYDSEGDAGLHHQINEHLAECPACAEWFHEQSRLEDLLVEKLRSAKPSRDLWDAILKECQIPRRVRTKRLLILCSFASIAALVFIALGIWQSGFWQYRRASASLGLSQLTAALHEQLVQGETDVDFASTSDLEVEGYLRKRVPFPVRCPPRQDAGFLVSGAGICRLSGDDAAYLVGRVAETPVSIFILPRESLSRFPRDRDLLERADARHGHEGGAATVMRQIDRNVVVVVGKIDSSRLQRVVDAYGSYPHDHSG